MVLYAFKDCTCILYMHICLLYMYMHYAQVNKPQNLLMKIKVRYIRNVNTLVLF